MSSFKNTSDWQIKDGTTLVYAYEYEGKRNEGSSEKKPSILTIQVERLSVLNQTSWELEQEKEPRQEAGFYTREYISAMGTLDNCRLHAISLDAHENEQFKKLDVIIYPIALEKLQKTAMVDNWSIIGENENRPEEGWMKDDIGTLDYHSEGEYHGEAQLTATLFLSQDKYEDLSLAIKSDSIRSARLEILADVFGFGYEGLGAGMRGHYYNYAILCQDEGDSVWGTPKGASGKTKARLQEVLLEWSPRLEAKMAARRDELEEVDLEPNTPEGEPNAEKIMARLARDVQAIRGKIDLFYQAAILVAVLLIIGQALDWLGL